MNTYCETVLSVSGMTCPSCQRHVDTALRQLDGVDHVEVKLREGEVVVTHDPALASVDALVGAIHDAGYEAAPSAR